MPRPRWRSIITEISVKKSRRSRAGLQSDLHDLCISATASRLWVKGISIKPPTDPKLGPGFMRVTTALPEDNPVIVEAFRELLS